MGTHFNTLKDYLEKILSYWSEREEAYYMKMVNEYWMCFSKECHGHQVPAIRMKQFCEQLNKIGISTM